MRYRYRNTNTIVESGRALDSAVFTPLVEQTEEAETEETKAQQMKPAMQPEKKAAPRQTTTRRKRG